MTRHDLKHLVIMRHGEADFPRGVPDHDRPLTRRGAREAADVGRWLAGHAAPDMILTSPALRTRQTVTWVCHELAEKAPTPPLGEGIYNATDAQLVAAVNHVPETVRTLLVVAHMPGVLDAVLRLASRDSEQDAMMDAASGFPTAGTAVLEVAGDWALLDGADARLTAFYAPRV